MHKKDLNIKVSTWTFTLYFDWIIFIHYIYIIIIIKLLLYIYSFIYYLSSILIYKNEKF